MIGIDITARVAEVTATLGMLPPALVGALRVRFFDYVNHHRAKLLSRTGRKHQADGRARSARRRFIAARTRRYSDGDRLDNLRGEGFAFGSDGAMQLAERGGSIRSSGLMAIPFDRNRQASGGAKRGFRNRLESGKFDIVAAGRGRLLLVRRVGGSRARTEIEGMLTRRRTQPAYLGFFDAEREVRRRHLAKMERAIGMAMSVAGREALTADAVRRERSRSAFRSARTRALSSGATPAEARRAAIAASRAARSVSERGGG